MDMIAMAIRADHGEPALIVKRLRDPSHAAPQFTRTLPRRESVTSFVP